MYRKYECREGMDAQERPGRHVALKGDLQWLRSTHRYIGPVEPGKVRETHPTFATAPNESGAGECRRELGRIDRIGEGSVYREARFQPLVLMRLFDIVEHDDLRPRQSLDHGQQ
jgi:hypothetical protein